MTTKQKAFVAPQPLAPKPLKKRVYTKEEMALTNKQKVEVRRLNEDRRTYEKA